MDVLTCPDRHAPDPSFRSMGTLTHSEKPRSGEQRRSRKPYALD